MGMRDVNALYVHTGYEHMVNRRDGEVAKTYGSVKKG
jgi:hypothetical protein